MCNALRTDEVMPRGHGYPGQRECCGKAQPNLPTRQWCYDGVLYMTAVRSIQGRFGLWRLSQRLVNAAGRRPALMAVMRKRGGGRSLLMMGTRSMILQGRGAGAG